MPRRVFFSFHFDNDFWRTQQVRQMGALEGQSLVTPNQWEEVKQRGDKAIQGWIDGQLDGKTCAIVLVGSETASRPWVQYEINKAWKDNRAVLGIRIHKMLNKDSKPSSAGPDPFVKSGLSGIAPLKDPAGADSKAVYATIASNIEAWIEEAISTRKRYK